MSTGPAQGTPYQGISEMASNFADRLKEKLNKQIDEMGKFPTLFAASNKAFTRTKKLDFPTVMKAVISMQGGTIGKELSKLGINVTASGFVQRRDQILSDAFEFLFHEFSEGLPARRTVNGYRIFAVDGSDILSPPNPESELYVKPAPVSKNGITPKTWNMSHINAMYDVLNRFYVDAILPYQFDEREAAEVMIKRYSGAPAILTADRGYHSYNLMETVNRNPSMEYLIRTPNRNTFYYLKDLPMTELDVDREADITTIQSEYAPGKNALLPGMPKYTKDKKRIGWKYGRNGHLKIRVVRFRINDDPDPKEAYETILTSLDRKKFPLKTIKYLYHLRWEIETSFRVLKYNVGVLNFHSRKDNAICQAMWAALTMYNFSMAIAGNVKVEVKARAYKYAVSISMAVFECLNFFSRILVHAPPDGKELMRRIASNIEPVRPDRKDERKMQKKGAVIFWYRIAA